MAADNHRALAAQATGLRWSELRRTNYVDQIIDSTPGGSQRKSLVIANANFANADTTDEATAEFGPAIRVAGYDRMTLLYQTTAGTTTTAFQVAAQISYNEHAPDAEWFDFYTDQADDGALVRKVYVLTTSVNQNAAWGIPTEGVYMRFKVWSTGANRSNSRAILWARRIMDSL